MATDVPSTPRHDDGAAAGAGLPGSLGLFTRIDHVGVAVSDLEQAKQLYSQVFGMRVAHEEENEEQGVREAMMSVDGVAGPYVQLLAPLRPDSPIGKFLARNGEGLQQVAYGVVDVDAAAETLRSRGVRLLYDVAKRGTGGSRVNFVHPKDAGGVLVELVEHSEQAGAAHAAAGGAPGS